MTHGKTHFVFISATIVFCFAHLLLPVCAFGSDGGALIAFPERVELKGNFAQTQLVVRAVDAGGDLDNRSADVTRTANYATSDSAVVDVDARGRLSAVANGTAEIRIAARDALLVVPVTVSDVVEEPQVRFDEDVAPVLSRLGCNMGACHAAQYGKGGFKLSVFGFDPRGDHENIIRDRRQRRVNFLEPEDSLLLKKPTMQVPHGGGLRLQPDSAEHRVLAAWLRSGAPGPQKEHAEVKQLVVTPADRVGDAGLNQQLRVDAVYEDGTSRDVTAWAKFDSMDDAVLSTTDDGHVTAVGKGQAPVMVRFEGQAEIASFVVPFGPPAELAGWESRNVIDELAFNKFAELGIEPSGLCDDATFLRRAFFDAVGTLPTKEETLAFLNSTDADKRDRLVDRLLGLTGDPERDVYNDRYAAYWTLKWSDLVRNTSNGNSVEQAMWALHNWIKESFRTNKPFNKFVSELVTAKGSIYSSGPANYFRINRTSTDLAESTAQIFLGVRLTCAKCHHHPFEKYSQADYYGFAAFFSRVGTKNSEEFGLFGRESVVMVKSSGEVRHARTGQVMKPTPLDGEPVDHPLDRRIPLAEWLTSSENDFFAKSVVNRYTGYLLGRGLVEPLDDMRATNPPVNPEMMDALTSQFIESGFDVKQLMQTIMTSRLYQLSSQPTEQNASDRRFYSHFKVKRIPAEPLLDAIDRVTGAQTKFKSLPKGTLAIELPDAEYPNYFLNTFAKPRRASVCECDRMPDESLAQALHTLNGDILARKIADKTGRVAKLLAAKTPHDEIVDDLYLAALSRHPTEAERAACDRFLTQSPSPKECYEDLLWALINSKQFLFVR